MFPCPGSRVNDNHGQIASCRVPTRSFFPGKVLSFDGSFGPGKVLNCIHFSKRSWKSPYICQKQAFT